MDKKIQSARNLLLRESFGVLSTISLDVPGYPFGSVAPYCTDELCRPVIYISQIAQHTQNILRDARVSLTVVEKNLDSDDVQARGRVTCVADARPIGEGETQIRERYFRYFPSARQYEQTHDFVFFRLEPVRMRFIGGFGQIYWIEPDEFMAKNAFSFQQESRIIDHMNNDHADALRHYARGASAVMVGIDGEGFDLLASGKKLRLEFATPVNNMEDARQALIAMMKRPA
jgi:heme oxygenase (biliverdin-IX-beta and delta-forming)